MLGLALVAVGSLGTWFFGFRPLQAAGSGASEVEFQLKLFVVAPMLIVGGMFLVLGGSKVGEAFSGPPVGKQQHMIVWSAFALAIAIGGFSYWWLDGKLAALGYLSS